MKSQSKGCLYNLKSEIMKQIDSMLTLVFTANLSLQAWAKRKNLNRVVEIYKRLADNLRQVNFITYGGKQDKSFSSKIQPIQLIRTQWHSNKLIILLKLLQKYYSGIQKTVIFKSNQILGSEITVWLKRIFKKKLINRYGYTFGKVLDKQE